MCKELESIIERYESILKDMHQTLDAIEQRNQTSQRITEIYQFLKQFDNIDEFISHIKDIEKRLFYLKDELTTKEAALYLGMSVSTLYKKTMNREIPFYRPPSNGRLFFKRQELIQWMLQNRYATNEEMQAEVSISGKTNLYDAKRSNRKTKKKQAPQ